MKRSLLEEKRREKGLFAQEVAQKLGVPVEAVLRWEAGELPDSEYLLPLSQLLGISVEEILRGEEEPGEEDACEGPQEGAVPAEPAAGEEAPPAQRESAPLAERAPAQEEAAPEKEKEEPESYYERLHRKMAKKGINNEVPSPSEPSGRNGFSRGERIFGYILCAVFLCVFALGLCAYYSRGPYNTKPEDHGRYAEAGAEICLTPSGISGGDTAVFFISGRTE